MEKSDALAALAALAHESRLDVFRLLVQAGAEGLPAGRFFVIAEVADPGGPRVVMRHVATHAGLLVILPLTTPKPEQPIRP